jgi:lipoprotein signal peptidase
MQSEQGSTAEVQPVRAGMAERLFVIVVAAFSLAAVDLDLKTAVSTPTWAYHYRPGSWVALCVVILVGALALARVPSSAVAVSAGILSGGVLGNLVSAKLNAEFVPNPIVIGNRFNGVAFNLADVFTLVGIVSLMGSLIIVSIRNRDRLPSPPRWEQWLHRRIGL